MRRGLKSCPQGGPLPKRGWSCSTKGKGRGLGGGWADPTSGERRTAACCYQRPTQGGAMVKGGDVRRLHGRSSAERTPQAPTVSTWCLTPRLCPGASPGSAARGGTAETGTRAPAPAKLLLSCHSVARRPNLLEGTVHTQGDTAPPLSCHRRAHSQKQQLGCSGSARRSGANHSFTRHSFTQRISPSPAMLCARHAAGTETRAVPLRPHCSPERRVWRERPVPPGKNRLRKEVLCRPPRVTQPRGVGQSRVQC